MGCAASTSTNVYPGCSKSSHGPPWFQIASSNSLTLDIKQLLIAGGVGRKTNHIDAQCSGGSDGKRGSADNLFDEEDMLSDITSMVSTCRSVTDAIPFESSVLLRSKDLERQQQQVLELIDEDLFVYDDAIVSKCEAQTKHWRIEGRRPRGASLHLARSNAAPDKKSTDVFCFADFVVCVDEVEFTTNNRSGSGGGCSLAILTGSVGSPKVAKVTCTFSQKDSVKTAVRARIRREQEEEMRGGLTASAQPRKILNFKMRSLIGHSKRVKCIALSSNERSFVSCSCDEASILLRSLRSGADEGIFTGHRDKVISAAYSPDGRYLATTSKDHSLILWDATITKLLYAFKHDKAVICCCFSPDSKLVVSGCQDRICRIWDIAGGREIMSYNRHTGIIVCVAYSPDGAHVCSASADKTLRVWSPTTGKTHLILAGHTGMVLACSFSSDGRRVISNDESLLCVWSTDDGSLVLRIPVTDFVCKSGFCSSVARVGWTLSCAVPGPFLNYAVVACTNRFVYVIDIQTGEEHINMFCKAPVYALASGRKCVISFGDSYGNVYVCEFH
ncbi:hypothetical protein TRVL_06387 [Trypanosoma vivax]|nr:hypothetical protein TRVL_06387 [Trypanosoma vivax]